VAAIYEDPGLLVDAIRAARDQAGMNQQALADELGTSVGTVKRWEKGELGTLGRTPNARRAVAVQVAEATGAPRELFGLPAAAGRGGRSTEQRVGVLELQMRSLLSLLEEREPEEIRELREASADVAQQYDPSSVPRGSPGSAAANG
jgi:transcriptional regulator with XRE-family HTH domain